MKIKLKISSTAQQVVMALQEAGFEAYIVGGAIRDLLLERTPKDFDIGCSATPEEVRQVFGRRNARIIGKRFRLAHVFCGGELFEVSTFRKAPANAGRSERKIQNSGKLPEHLIVSDNSFGTAREDAWRRDFTANALFYDPIKHLIIDHTGKGMVDIENRIVRAIGDPDLRFEEDPVRMLRALKLVGQHDFTLDNTTEDALFRQLPLLRHASPSRLSLELEKVLESVYGDRQLQAFHDFGLLAYFLPEIDKRWGTPAVEYMLDLLFERNCRVDEGIYRNSISLAMAIISLPFVEEIMGSPVGGLWKNSSEASAAVKVVIANVFQPLNMMARMTMSAERILFLLPELESSISEKKRNYVLQQRSYGHARELMLIRHAVAGEDTSSSEIFWPPAGNVSSRPPRNPKKNGGRHKKKRNGN